MVSMVRSNEQGLASGQPTRTLSYPSPITREESHRVKNSEEGTISSNGTVSSGDHSELINDPGWAGKERVDKWEALKYAAKNKYGTMRSNEFKKAYQEAIEDCVYEAGDKQEPTILHYLIRTIEPHQFIGDNFYGVLVEVSIAELAARLGSSGLGDSLHNAIERKHFSLLKFICDKANSPELTKLVGTAITFRKSKDSEQNCLHAIIAADPRNITVVRALIEYADDGAFKTQRKSDGNTPLHDFVKFSEKRFRICHCRCENRCAAQFPDSVRDEHQYTVDFVATLRILIGKDPDVLSISNNEGKTPFVVHIESRKQAIGDGSWDGLEYESTPREQAVDIGTNDRQHATVDTSEVAGNPNGKRISWTQSNEINGTTKSPSLMQPNPPDHQKPFPKKTAVTSTKTSPQYPAHDNPNGWSLSEHLAREVSRELLEACSSLPSWDKATKSIFGDRHPEDQSILQTSFKMEDSLYKDIEKDHEFLRLNSILAYVELSLTSPCQDARPDQGPYADLDMDEIIDIPHHITTPELTRSSNVGYLRAVFKWLGEKGVKRILKLVVLDNQEWQCSDDTIAECLTGWDVRYLDWNKRDLSIETIRNGNAEKLVELWLTWSGQNTALLGWSDRDDGLKKQLPQLKRVHIEVHSSVEPVARMNTNLEAFQKRIKERFSLEFKLPRDLRTGSNAPRKGTRGNNFESDNEYHHRWMEAIRNFKQQVTASYNMLKEGNPDRKRLNENPIKVALIDDGVNPSKLHVKGSVKGGWPPDGFARGQRVSTYYNSSDGHGTTMANLIHYVCPFVHLYVAKLDKSPPPPYRSVAHMAAEAVKWAVFSKVDVISMSWTIKDEAQADGSSLTEQITEAERAGIVLFCSSDDKGQHNNAQNQLLPSPSNLLKRIGSCNGNGTKSDFVNETEIHYLFPGEQLPVMQQHWRSKRGELRTDRGSSASTALAAGLASLILWCTVKSGGERDEFSNERMYALFDKLKTDQNKASLVDVSGLMDQVRAQGDTAHKTVRMFVERLREKIPDERRRWEDMRNPS